MKLGLGLLGCPVGTSLVPSAVFSIAILCCSCTTESSNSSLLCACLSSIAFAASIGLCTAFRINISSPCITSNLVSKFISSNIGLIFISCDTTSSISTP